VATLSSQSRSLELLPVLFREASEARRQKLLRPEPILCFEDIERPRPLSQGAAAELEQFDEMLGSSELDAADGYIAELPHSPWMSVAFLEELRNILSRRVERAPEPLEAYFRLRDFLADASAAIRQDATPTPRDGGDTRDAALVAEARRYVLSDLARNTDLASVARHVGLSYAYFSTLFKDTAAVAFSDFVRQARMEEASRLLRTGHPSVTEVAQRIGYHYPKHFTRAFKQYFGVSPRDYAGTNHPQQENDDETD
jgi:AraC-like DNA-binding protein